MIQIRKAAAALCLVLLALPVLGGCGGGGEDWIIGEVISVSPQEAAIRPLTPDEMEGVPYRKELKDVEQITFSTESLDDFGAEVGNIVIVTLWADDFPTEPVSQIEVLSWAPYPPED